MCQGPGVAGDEKVRRLWLGAQRAGLEAEAQDVGRFLGRAARLAMR